MNQSHHKALLSQAFQVSPQSAPGLSQIIEKCVARLRPGKIDVFVAPSNKLNAYTFGIGEVKSVVLYSPLLQVMDADELSFIVGHELGHVALGHSWLNTLLGGMAGIPLPIEAAVILNFAFRGWNRACEYSADRAGLLACGNINKAISALVKLVDANADTKEELQRALKIIEQEDDSIVNVLAETLATHPMIVRRIDQLKRYAASDEYRRLQNERLS